MKFVKWFIIFVAALLLLFVVVTFFLPKDYHVERSVKIRAPVDLIYNQVANLESWQTWNPWSEMDPDMVVTYGESTTGIGASYSWTSEVAGSGKMTIIEAEPLQSVRYELVFEGYESLPSYSSMILDPESPIGPVTVTWTFEGDVGDKFFARWMTVMIDNFVGESYEKGLQQLKARCERLAEAIPSGPVPSSAG